MAIEASAVLSATERERVEEIDIKDLPYALYIANGGDTEGDEGKRYKRERERAKRHTARR